MDMQFEEIYDQFFKDVYLYIFALSRDPHLAEDITQETFFKAMKGLKHFRGDCSVKSWLCQIAKNLYLSHVRKNKNGTLELPETFRLISTWSVLLPIERPLFPSIGFFTYWKNRTKKCSLYEDGLCSERSRDLIEEHLSECETCRNIYKTIHEEIRVTEPISENSAEAESFTQTAQADILKYLSRKLRQDKLFAGGCMLIIGLVLAILFSWLSETMFFDSQFGTVPIVDYRIKAEDITVTELYELKNGDIYCTLDSRKPLSIITSSSEILPFRKLYSILYILRKKGYTRFIIEEMRADHVSFMGKRI